VRMNGITLAEFTRYTYAALLLYYGYRDANRRMCVGANYSDLRRMFLVWFLEYQETQDNADMEYKSVWLWELAYICIQRGSH
jgi:hypothetical protein